MEECENAKLAANDMLKLRLYDQIEKIKGNIKCISQSIDKNQASWPESKVNSLTQEVSELNQRLKEKEQLIIHEDKYNKYKYNRAVKRLASDLLEQNRIKRRKLGAGPPEKVSAEDEDVILKIVEGQGAHAHGRRHDDVCYIYDGGNKKVKKEDFKRYKSLS